LHRIIRRIRPGLGSTTLCRRGRCRRDDQTASNDGGNATESHETAPRYRKSRKFTW
jgi:hypothetical protein